jgi:hypothetical protein
MDDEVCYITLLFDMPNRQVQLKNKFLNNNNGMV